MALESRESDWLEYYRAATKRRRGRISRLLSRLYSELREPLDAAVVIGVIFGSALLLTWVFPF
jgi:hypothetical protein